MMIERRRKTRNDRIVAMQWWNDLKSEEKWEVLFNHFDHTREPDSLTGSEIESIWYHLFCEVD
jgi:hypothetical protein